MPPNTSDRERHLERQRRAWDLRQQGWSQRRIAADLRVDQGTVCRLLGRVYARALARLDKRAAHERAVQVDQLNHIVDEALQAWERSKKPRKRSSKRTGSGGKDGAGEATTVEAQERDGDPAFLASAMSALDRIRELLALNVKAAGEEASDASDLRTALLAAEAADADYRPDPDPADEPTPEPPAECSAEPQPTP